MKIANEETFRNFDKLKDTMFAHRKSEYEKTKVVKNPIGFKFRVLLPLALVGGGLWVAYRSTPKLHQQLLKRQMITYQQFLFWTSFKLYLKCRWQQFLQHPSIHGNKKLANKCYTTKLQSDLLYLREKAPEKKLSIETQSNLSIWIFNWKNTEKIRLINENGDLVERNRKSKLMLGNLLRIWGDSSDTIIERQRIFSYYERQIANIGNECEKMNWLNKKELSEQQYSQILTQCYEQTSEIRKKLVELINQRHLQEQKKKVVIRTEKK